MMKLQLLITILSLSLHTALVTAWTQYQNFGHRLLNSVLRLRDQDDLDLERTRLENLWDFTNDDEDNFPPLFSTYDQIRSLPVGEWAEGVHNEWTDVCFGDECDVSCRYLCFMLSFLA